MKLKRILSDIFLLAGLLISTVTQATNPMLIYRNDGGFNAIPRTEIESISFSHYDIDSTHHSSIVVQDIRTVHGNIIRIPLENIERVAFETPETRIKPDVVEINEDILSNLLYVESDTILHFDPVLPEKGHLKQGVKLVTLDMSDKLPIGFIGEIENISFTENDIAVKCRPTALSDVYDSLFLYSDINFSNNGNEEFADNDTHPQPIHADPYKINIDNSFNLPTLSRTIALSGSLGIADHLNIGASHQATFELSPKLHIQNCIALEHGSLNTSTTLTADLYLDEHISHSFNGNIEKEWSLITTKVPIAAAPLFKLFMNAGIRASFDGSLGAEMSFNQHYRLTAHTSHSSKKDDAPISPTLKFELIDNSSNVYEAFGDCSVKFGPYIQFGLSALTPELANANIETESGIQFTATAGIDLESYNNATHSPSLYEKLSKPDAISIGQYQGASLNVEFLGGLVKGSTQIAYNLKPEWSKSILPILSDVVAQRDDFPSLLGVNAKMTPGLICNRNVGFSLIENSENSDGNPVFKGSAVYSSEDNEVFLLSRLLDHVDIEKTYKLYPTIEFHGKNILASPMANVKSDLCRIENVRQIAAEQIGLSQVRFTVEVDTDCDSKHWSITGNETELTPVDEGKATTQWDITTSYFDGNIDTSKLPYEFTTECYIIPHISGLPKYEYAHLLTLKHNIVPENYYLIGSFQDWHINNEKTMLRFTPMGGGIFRTTVRAKKLDNGKYEPIYCKIIPDFGIGEWGFQIGGKNGILKPGEPYIQLSNRPSYTIVIDMNNFTYSVQ